MNGLFCAGGLFGAIFVGWSCDALGRKPTLWIASPLAIIGGALQAGAVHIAMFLVGRFIGGFAVGLFCGRLFQLSRLTLETQVFSSF
jgi:predicted MFS family arabinose efflux permease